MELLFLKGLDGEAGVITFKFTPSEMYADDTVFYTFNFTNVVGKLSNKKPNPAVYLCSYPCAAYAYKAQGFDWNVFGKPALLENGDLSTNGWKTSDGSDVADELKDRLVLVASKTTSAQESKMNSMVEDKLSGELLTSDTYNISLTLCKQMVIQTGDGVRVSLGFPEGYGPEHAGVTFKAYHFTRDKLGNITGVEEIPCVITPYGLIITCTSFSPFAIVAAEDTTPPGTALDKTVILSASEGGRIQGDQKSDMYALSTGKSTSVEIKADEGYAIESITVDGKPLEGVYEKNSYSLKLNYGQMASNVATIVDAQFISKQAIERDKARNEQPETEAEAQSGNKATQQPEGTQAPAQDPLPAVPEEHTSGTLPGSTGLGGSNVSNNGSNGLGGVSATPTPEWTYAPDPTPKADSARRSGGSAQQPADDSGGETLQPEPTAGPQPTAPAPLAPQPIVLPAVNETDEAVNAQPDSLISDLELSADTAPAAADIAASAPQKRGMLYFWIGLAFTAGVGLLSGLLFLVVRSRR